jgi:hypothetical protein
MPAKEPRGSESFERLVKQDTHPGCFLEVCQTKGDTGTSVRKCVKAKGIESVLIQMQGSGGTGRWFEVISSVHARVYIERLSTSMINWMDCDGAGTRGLSFGRTVKHRARFYFTVALEEVRRGAHPLRTPQSVGHPEAFSAESVAPTRLSF